MNGYYVLLGGAVNGYYVLLVCGMMLASLLALAFAVGLEVGRRQRR